MLTLLIHLGYLSYNETTRTVHIPNEEIRLEFSRAIRQVKRDDTIRRVQESEQLIIDTVHGNETAVAKQIEKIHDRHYPETIKGYGGDILLVGISYDKEAQAGRRKHHCRIEKIFSPSNYPLLLDSLLKLIFYLLSGSPAEKGITLL